MNSVIVDEMKISIMRRVFIATDSFPLDDDFYNWVKQYYPNFILHYVNSRSDIFALYHKSEDDVNEYIRIVRDWMSKLPHLPNESIGDEFLELCLLKNKFSIEKCKTKIEMYCTLKADPHYGYAYSRIPVPSKEPSFYTPLPELTDDFKRIVIFRIKDVEKFQMLTDLQCNVAMREFLMRFDYNDGEIQVIDLRNCPASIVTKIRINILFDILTLILQGYSTRLSGVHIISKTGKSLVSTVLPLLPTKIASRFQFHDDIDSLLNVFPGEKLPSDYGGKLKSLEEIQNDWDRIFVENSEQLKGFMNMKAREDLRNSNQRTEEEMNGSFRKLVID